MLEDYISMNRTLWETRVDSHVESDFYDVPSFLNGKTSLNEIELEFLTDVKGRSIAHLQCHFGMDSLSLARMGAKVTGLDFSEKAIAYARELNEKLGLDAQFVCENVLTATNVLPKASFDIVFASYGVIGWLQDLSVWAEQIDAILAPGGKVLFVEFHPFVWMYDNDFKKIDYSYFNTEEIIEQNEVTYTGDAHTSVPSISFNHSISEVIEVFLQRKMKLTHISEYNYSPYNCFSNTVPHPKGYQIKGFEDKFPMVYAVVFEKPKLQ